MPMVNQANSQTAVPQVNTALAGNTYNYNYFGMQQDVVGSYDQNYYGYEQSTPGYD